MADYQLMAPMPGAPVRHVLRSADGACIPFDPANKDYQEYLAWLDAGNAADPPPLSVNAQSDKE